MSAIKQQPLLNKPTFLYSTNIRIVVPAQNRKGASVYNNGERTNTFVNNHFEGHSNQQELEYSSNVEFTRNPGNFLIAGNVNTVVHVPRKAVQGSLAESNQLLPSPNGSGTHQFVHQIANVDNPARPDWKQFAQPNYWRNISMTNAVSSNNSPNPVRQSPSIMSFPNRSTNLSSTAAKVVPVVAANQGIKITTVHDQMRHPGTVFNNGYGHSYGQRASINGRIENGSVTNMKPYVQAIRTPAPTQNFSNKEFMDEVEKECQRVQKQFPIWAKQNNLMRTSPYPSNRIATSVRKSNPSNRINSDPPRFATSRKRPINIQGNNRSSSIPTSYKRTKNQRYVIRLDESSLITSRSDPVEEEIKKIIGQFLFIMRHKFRKSELEGNAYFLDLNLTKCRDQFLMADQKENPLLYNETSSNDSQNARNFEKDKTMSTDLSSGIDELRQNNIISSKETSKRSDEKFHLKRKTTKDSPDRMKEIPVKRRKYKDTGHTLSVETLNESEISKLSSENKPILSALKTKEDESRLSSKVSSRPNHNRNGTESLNLTRSRVERSSDDIGEKPSKRPNYSNINRESIVDSPRKNAKSVMSIDAETQSLCPCGERERAYNEPMYCDGTKICYIPPNAEYYQFINTDHKQLNKGVYNICRACYRVAKNKISLCDKHDQINIPIPKSQFKKKVNNQVTPEEMVGCIQCERKWHKVCALYVDGVSYKGFICPSCMEELETKPRQNPFPAKNLPETRLSKHLEKHVQKLLKEDEFDGGEVTIRVLSSSKGVYKVETMMQKHFSATGEFPKEFPYQKKVIFAFQNIDGQDVCFFGLYVQEYGSDCPIPNRGRVYISMLDSVFYFQPKKLRTLVYHEILIRYLEYAKKHGYTMAHIWSCPPGKNVDYIFFRHPPEQKIPSESMLRKWYTVMLNSAKKAGIVTKYMHIQEYIKQNKIEKVTQLPYFKGDHWPQYFECLIEELDTQKNTPDQRKVSVRRNTVETGGFHSNDSSMSPTNGRNQPSRLQGVKEECDFSNKMFKMFKREVSRQSTNFFVIYLQDPKSSADKPESCGDSDYLLPSAIMSDRPCIFFNCGEKLQQFCTLRWTKFSSLALLRSLYVERFFTCRDCGKVVARCLNCPECCYTLCDNCYARCVHSHVMHKLKMKSLQKYLSHVPQNS